MHRQQGLVGSWTYHLFPLLSPQIPDPYCEEQVNAGDTHHSLGWQTNALTPSSRRPRLPPCRGRRGLA